MPSPEQLKAAHKEWARDLLKTLILGALGLLAIFAWVWIRTPKPPTAHVISVNYQRSEYTAILDGERIVARCPQGTCPGPGDASRQ